MVYYLHNAGADGPSTARPFKRLELEAPTAPTQHNFDTDRDGIAGLSLEPTTDGWAEADTRRIQRFFLDTGGSVVNGPATVRLWVANENPGNTTTLRLSIADCPEETPFVWAWSCTTAAIVESSVAVTNDIGSGFQEVVIDLGDPNYTFGGSRELTLRVIAEGSDTVHTAFDSLTYPSQITLTLN